MGSDEDVERAARVSYGYGTRKTSQTRGLIRYLRRHKHTTPSEMVELKFHCAMPVFVARQWIRHRTASVNEYSGRYSLLPLLYYRPERDQLQAQSATNRQGRSGKPLDAIYDDAMTRWERLRAEASSTYEWLVQEDVARELARIDLPLSVYTQWYWKIDLHNLLHFLTLRVDAHAQYEIRAFGVVMAGMLQRVAPLCFEAWLDYDVMGSALSRGELAALRRLVRVRDGGIEGIAERVTAAELEKLGLAKREVEELLGSPRPRRPTSRSTCSRTPGVRSRNGGAVGGGPLVSGVGDVERLARSVTVQPRRREPTRSGSRLGARRREDQTSWSARAARGRALPHARAACAAPALFAALATLDFSARAWADVGGSSSSSAPTSTGCARSSARTSSSTAAASPGYAGLRDDARRGADRSPRGVLRHHAARGDGGLPGALARQAAARGRPGRRRQDGAREGAGGDAPPSSSASSATGPRQARALFEWNYQKQLLRIQADRREARSWGEVAHDVFSREFLLERPLLRAITAPTPVVLLVDEIDKADLEFEAFLLEVLSDFQVSVPELGTIRATHRPVVVLTSNRTRELSEALLRRCLHLFVEFPGPEKEAEIVALKVPEADARLARQIARFVAGLRKLDLRKAPSIAETLDWARGLCALGVRELDAATVRQTLALVLKHEDDLRKAESKVSALLASTSR
jgi:flavin-dependent thymidylate synthase